MIVEKARLTKKVLMITTLGVSVVMSVRVPSWILIVALEIGRFLQSIDAYAHLHPMFFLECRTLFVHDFTVEMLPKQVRYLHLLSRTRVRTMWMLAACDISVIIPALNEEKYLPRCLKSLVCQSGGEDFEIIVVDGGSLDRTVEVAKEYADRVVIQPIRPVGAARNVGVRHASGTILAFMDADTVACKCWLEEVGRAFSSSEVVGVTGPTLPYGATELDRLVYHIATGFGQRLSFRLGFPHVAGFNCAYRRRQFLSVGGFDENRKLSEDVALSLRIRHQGKILFNPKMVAYTSLRRIKKYGYPYLTTYYAINGVMMLLFKRTLGYPEVR